MDLTPGIAAIHIYLSPTTALREFTQICMPEAPGKERWGNEEIQAGSGASLGDTIAQSNNPGPRHEGSPEISGSKPQLLI